jgi:rRNA maturation RNase YbeY
MAKVNFFSEDSSYSPKNKRDLKRWLEQAITAEGFTLNELNFIICTDEYLLQVNRDFLQHDYYTDVITFDNSEQEGQIVSDIFISIDRVKENAKLHQISTANELHRIMIHGALHLLGYRDKSKKAKIEMTEKEDFYLALRHFG